MRIQLRIPPVAIWTFATCGAITGPDPAPLLTRIVPVPRSSMPGRTCCTAATPPSR
ncbi:hypothetical protein M271_39100 [Streptomyces rapamycinicus NRRL 5491]|nr:hypothetical protein M271_39100 [Streptomyces rapamycinicus NRRL 5491]